MFHVSPAAYNRLHLKYTFLKVVEPYRFGLLNIGHILERQQSVQILPAWENIG